MYIYICMYIHIYIYVYISMYIYIHVFMFIYLYIYFVPHPMDVYRISLYVSVKKTLPPPLFCLFFRLSMSPDRKSVV